MAETRLYILLENGKEIGRFPVRTMMRLFGWNQPNSVYIHARNGKLIKGRFQIVAEEPKNIKQDDSQETKMSEEWKRWFRKEWEGVNKEADRLKKRRDERMEKGECCWLEL